MTAQTKGRIRHVALSVEDPWETAEFYKQAVGLQEVSELDGPLAEGVFLTDGIVNLAILHFKSDEAAQGTGKDYVGHPSHRLLGRRRGGAGQDRAQCGRHLDHGRSEQPGRLRGQAHRPVRDHLRHCRAWLGRFAEEPGIGRQRRTSQSSAQTGEVRRSARARPGEDRFDAGERGRRGSRVKRGPRAFHVEGPGARCFRALAMARLRGATATRGPRSPRRRSAPPRTARAATHTRRRRTAPDRCCVPG